VNRDCCLGSELECEGVKVSCLAVKCSWRVRQMSRDEFMRKDCNEATEDWARELRVE